MTAPAAIARALYAALEAGVHGDDLRQFFTDDAVTIEHPNQIKPEGSTAALDAMIAGSTAGANLLASQRYDVHDVLEVGALAIFRIIWTGVIAADVGPFRAGQAITAHIAQFVETRDGKVAKIETYDCYDPF
jgi:ketosteroid isomerase-like protein